MEHAYPSALLGWVVIVLRRHAEAIHSLSREEAEELGVLQWAVGKVLASETGCEKEYSIFFAEMPRFSHLHIHMVPRAGDLPDELRGGKIFAMLKAPEDEVIAPAEVASFCDRAGPILRRLVEGRSPDGLD